MKYLVLVFLALSTLFSCGTAQNEGTAAREEAKDSAQTEAKVVAPAEKTTAASMEAIWKREFVYEDPGQKEGKWEMGNTYYLDPAQNELGIAGYSMGCPRAKIRTESKYTEDILVVIFKEYLDKTDIDGRGFPEFEAGDSLLTLTKEENGFSTTWIKLSPIYGKVESPCQCFE